MKPVDRTILYLLGTDKGLGTAGKTASTSSSPRRGSSMSSADRARTATAITQSLTEAASSIAQSVAEARGARRAAASEAPVEDLGPIRGDVSVSTPWGKIAIGGIAAVGLIGVIGYLLMKKQAPAPAAKAA